MVDNLKDFARDIIKTIEKRKDKSDTGTLTRIYSYCKKQIKLNSQTETYEK